MTEITKPLESDTLQETCDIVTHHQEYIIKREGEYPTPVYQLFHEGMTFTDTLPLSLLCTLDGTQGNTPTFGGSVHIYMYMYM